MSQRYTDDMKRTPWLALLLVVVLVGCTEEPDPIPDASVTVLQPASQPPEDTPSPPQADTWTLTDTGAAVYIPPEPEPPAYDPCATDPITGNVQDGDCFAE